MIASLQEISVIVLSNEREPEQGQVLICERRESPQIRRTIVLATSKLLLLGTAFLSSGVTLTALAQSTPQGQANFPDIQNNWAQPFITALADRNILNGYPDGNYRPDRPVERDEFAAIIRNAFNQNRERQLSRGSAYRDVPRNYWAESAIEEAYEMGFMRGFGDGTFRPSQPITRAEVLTALARNLELDQRVPTTPQSSAPANQQNTQAQTAQQAQQSASPQTARRRSIFLPLAVTSLMQPLMQPLAAAAQSNNAARPAQQTAQAAPQKAQPQKSEPNAREIVQQFYTDANQIPQFAVDAIASTTKAGVVVNHPDLKTLRPNQPATRSDVAAFIHQALVNKQQLPPLENNAATRFIVGRDQINANR